MIGSSNEPRGLLAQRLEDALRVIREKASELRFGTITLTLHDGRLTQLEVSEKCRFDAQSLPAEHPKALS